MKFKKVEISAFRIYDDPKDATFDLTTKSGNAAGFVSLYAPNGFGKTSFYDAVEFGVTKSINRFYLRSKELEKLADFQNIQNQLPFIRNSKSVLDTYVKIYTDQQNEVITTPFRKHGNQTHDLNFKKPVIHDFQKVILSQEWISAFLTESDGEARYKKFMENPQLSEANNYYGNLRNLGAACRDKAEELNENISLHLEKIQGIETENILEAVNRQIALLKGKYGQEWLFPLSSSSTQEEIINFRDSISNSIISSDKQPILNQFLDYVATARSGRDHIVGMEVFLANKTAYDVTRQTIGKNKELLEKFAALENNTTSLENVGISLRERLSKKESLDTIFPYIITYERISEELSAKATKSAELENNLVTFNISLEQLKRSEITIQNQIASASAGHEELAKSKSKLPFIRTELEKTNLEIVEIEKMLSDAKNSQEQQQKNQRELDTTMTSIRKIIEEIIQDQYPTISLDENSELIQTIAGLWESTRLVSVEEQKLQALELTINQQQTLNNTIEEFVKAGLDIVNKAQLSTCPLCEHAYSSYNTLAEKITNNNALDQVLKQLLSEKSTINNQLAALLEIMKVERNKLLLYYESQFNNLLDKKRQIQKQVELMEDSIRHGDIELGIANNKKDGFIVELNGSDPDEFEKKLDVELEQKVNERNQAYDAYSIINRDIETTNQAIESAKKTIDLLKNEIADLKRNERYRMVSEWSKDNFPGQTIDLVQLDEKRKDLINSIQAFEDIQNQLTEKVDQLRRDLVSHKKQDLLDQKVDLENLLLHHENRIINYQNFLKDQLGIEMAIWNETFLNEVLEQKHKDYTSQLAICKELLDEYQKLEKYSEHILPFLQSEAAKIKLSAIQEELFFLINDVKPAIEQEREKTKAYLEARVKNFFYEHLINELYKKIDPHPDFKSVQFKANFEADNPRLDVFVKNTKNENTLIPNLYFSTAQINILSLSIFLAGALNSKDYQCIFVDDPIQSMDSINVLSTIDLLRSLVVNEGKQIILSTHDENFHNLLKKKMPPELFESKFLELESFGKVRLN